MDQTGGLAKEKDQVSMDEEEHNEDPRSPGMDQVGMTGIEDDVDILRKSGKGSPGKGKGKRGIQRHGMSHLEEQLEYLDVVDAEDDQATVEVVGVTTEVNPLDTYCNQAIFSYCRLDVLKPPAPLKFGTWNDRPLLEKQAKSFATQISNTTFRPFAQGNLLPIIVERKYIDPACLQMNPNTEMAPILRLSAEALDDPKFELKLAGGRHRRRATEILREQSKARVLKLRDSISDVRMKMKEADEKNKKLDKFEDKLRGLEKMLEEERQVEKTISMWGVILYDAGKSGLIQI
jgi:hypothetical protein